MDYFDVSLVFLISYFKVPCTTLTQSTMCICPEAYHKINAASSRGLCMNSPEILHIQFYHYRAILINEQHTAEHNRLCDMVYDIQLQHKGITSR